MNQLNAHLVKSLYRYIYSAKLTGNCKYLPILCKLCKMDLNGVEKKKKSLPRVKDTRKSTMGTGIVYSRGEIIRHHRKLSYRIDDWFFDIESYRFKFNIDNSVCDVHLHRQNLSININRTSRSYFNVTASNLQLSTAKQ